MKKSLPKTFLCSNFNIGVLLLFLLLPTIGKSQINEIMNDEYPTEYNHQSFAYYDAYGLQHFIKSTSNTTSVVQSNGSFTWTIVENNGANSISNVYYTEFELPDVLFFAFDDNTGLYDYWDLYPYSSELYNLGSFEVRDLTFTVRRDSDLPFTPPTEWIAYRGLHNDAVLRFYAIQGRHPFAISSATGGSPNIPYYDQYSIFYPSPDLKSLYSSDLSSFTKVADFDHPIRSITKLGSNQILTLTSAESDSECETQLWVSDNTEDNKTLIKSFSCTDQNGFENSRSFFNSPGFETAYFFLPTVSYDGSKNYISSDTQFWKTDGTSAGTTLINNNPPLEGFYKFLPNGTLTYISQPSHQLIGYDPSTNTSVILAENVNVNMNDFAPKEGLTLLNDQVYFTSGEGFESSIWVSDGTEAGTYPIKEDCSARGILEYNNRIYFLAYENESTTLYYTDGTVAGTNPMVILNTPKASTNHTAFTFINDYFLFYTKVEDRTILWNYNINSNTPNTCFASEVVEFNQGYKNNSTPVRPNRSNPELALNQPQENNEYNFVALGFGGSITLKLAERVYGDGTSDPDMILVETSFGRADQQCIEDGELNYPEEAYVKLSADGETWYSLPNSYCRTSFLDIQPAIDNGMPYAEYIRITDSSDPTQFNGAADGFDLDGIITCPQEVFNAQQRLTNARTAASDKIFDENFFNTAPNEVIDHTIMLYPNPASGQAINLNVQDLQPQQIEVEIYNILGKEVKSYSYEITEATSALPINIQELKPGSYTLRLISFENTESANFIKSD
ncbi:T9SS type A sorting domain-containing protein [Fulvivirga maritima]|uniref:T9SS type A sorting domain-containing protein n=1 Tax=Fulvivirga maritima TaxID=2904247 RepID=UPI001F1A94DA|nr:T9SS type A sorting domain-containing protein [Fulvivirga maritima]UII25043.1 T9SS type A sorting domain-containing protein [Fulvivirga maritima]